MKQVLFQIYTCMNSANSSIQYLHVSDLAALTILFNILPVFNILYIQSTESDYSVETAFVDGTSHTIQ